MTPPIISVAQPPAAATPVESDPATQGAGGGGKNSPIRQFLMSRSSGKLFCQVLLSALELDDTRKPAPYREGPRRFRFSIQAGPV